VDVNAVHSSGNTALELAVTRNDVESVRMLIRAGAIVGDPVTGESLLLVAATHASGGVIRQLVRAGADPNGENEAGAGDFVGLPLIEAAYAGNIGAVDALMKAGARINQPVGPDQYTPVAAAASVGDLVLVQLLFELGADITWETTTDGTPAVIAA